MNVTGAVSFSPEVSQREVRSTSAPAFLLEKMGLTDLQVASVLADPDHAVALAQLFHPDTGVLTMEPVHGQPGHWTIVGHPDGELPPMMLSLAKKLEGVSPKLAAVLVAAALAGKGDPEQMAGLVTLCASAWKHADLPGTAQVLDKDTNKALQNALRDLLARQDLPIEVNLQWSPLVEYDHGKALESLAKMPQPGSSLSSDIAVDLLASQFYAALLHHDEEVMTGVMDQLSQWPDDGAQTASLVCKKEGEAVISTSLPTQQSQETVGESHLVTALPLPTIFPNKPLPQPPTGVPKSALEPPRPVPKPLPPTPPIRASMPQTLPVEDMLSVLQVSLDSSLLEVMNREGPGMLAKAIEEGDSSQFKEILGNPQYSYLVSVRPPPGGDTLLSLACAKGDKDIVFFLLHCKDIDVNTCSFGPTYNTGDGTLAHGKEHADFCPLVIAAMAGHAEIVSLLQWNAHTDLNAVNCLGQTPSIRRSCWAMPTW